MCACPQITHPFDSLGDNSRLRGAFPFGAVVNSAACTFLFLTLAGHVSGGVGLKEMPLAKDNSGTGHVVWVPAPIPRTGTGQLPHGPDPAWGSPASPLQPSPQACRADPGSHPHSAEGREDKHRFMGSQTAGFPLTGVKCLPSWGSFPSLLDCPSSSFVAPVFQTRAAGHTRVVRTRCRSLWLASSLS